MAPKNNFSILPTINIDCSVKIPQNNSVSNTRVTYIKNKRKIIYRERKKWKVKAGIFSFRLRGEFRLKMRVNISYRLNDVIN